MERLSSLDGVFLAVEDPRTPMTIGTVGVFDGPVPTLDEVRAFLAERVASVPRCRQRVREPAGPVGRPVWIDAVRFDLHDHVHGRSLAGRGVDPLADPLEDLVAELMARRLDRRRPLWELWVVDGVTDHGWAIVAKVHHCMVDGIAGNDLLGAILADADPAVPDRWAPAPEPSAWAFAWWNVLAALGSLAAHARGAARVLTHPSRSWRRARGVLGAAQRLWFRRPHRPTSLVGPVGTRRRWTHLAVPLDDVATVRAAFGGTLNDVVVAAVTAGFRELLLGRGEPVEDRTVTAMIPVSLRTPAERGQTGNRVANVHALLPVGNRDPRSTLQAVHEHLEELKRSHEVEATGLLLRIGDVAPRFLADRVARTVLHRQRNVETVITDVPGPRTPLHLAGRRMAAGYPVAPVAGQVRTAVAIWSYCGQLAIGVTADRDSVPDVDRLGRGIARGFAELLEAARSASGAEPMDPVAVEAVRDPGVAQTLHLAEAQDLRPDA